MKIFVCVKQVPDTETKIKIGPDGASIDTTTIKWVMNPYDEFAVEEAVKTKEANAGAQVFVVTAGPKKRAGEVLRTALAMGADEGIVIDTPEFVDPLVTAHALAAAIKAEGGGDLIFTGKLAIDDNASSVGQMVAEVLGLPHTSVVSKFSLSPEGVTVERDVEGGTKEVVKMQRPALIAANKGLNMPRYASLPGIMKAKKKVLKELDLTQLGVSAQGKTKTLKIELPAEKPAVKMLTGDVSAQAAQLVSSLRDEAKVL
ncbi:MAG: electron transfer flavoprotein subunit beta/FixA family protein [Pseudobdellovibrionaceae bacterium]